MNWILAGEAVRGPDGMVMGGGANIPIDCNGYTEDKLKSIIK